jgi:hypothetical protein
VSFGKVQDTAILTPLGIQPGRDPSGHAVTARWNPSATKAYQPEWAPNLNSLSWANLGWPLLRAKLDFLTDSTLSTARKSYRVVEQAQPVILDPAGNLVGYPNRSFMDIIATTLRTEGTNSVLDVQMAAPIPTPAQMTGGKRFDVLGFVDIDRNRATGRSAAGDDYLISIWLTESSWDFSWGKVSPVSLADGVDVSRSAFKIVVSGDRATLTFPQGYLPSRSFDMLAHCAGWYAPNWPPTTQNPDTLRAGFDF